MSLEKIKPGVNGELQLSDGIQGLIDVGHKVTSLRIKKLTKWIDVGTPKTFWQAQTDTYSYFKK